MKRIAQGVLKFQREVFGARRDLFESLSRGQKPHALFITCSDSRILPSLMTQTEPGELFIIRNAGNIIPPYNTAAIGGEAGTLEYAIEALNVKHVIVCGHSHCGAMTSLLHPEQVEKLAAVRSWLGHAEATRRIMERNHPGLDESERVNVAVGENVLVQLENLRTHPSVCAAMARRDLELHAWVYRPETGEVMTYDFEQRRYISLAEQEDLSLAASET